MNYTINFLWDSEARVWVASSEDIPGLLLEGGSYDALIERVRFAVPDFLELTEADEPINLTFLSKRQDKTAI